MKKKALILSFLFFVFHNSFGQKISDAFSEFRSNYWKEYYKTYLTSNNKVYAASLTQYIENKKISEILIFKEMLETYNRTNKIDLDTSSTLFYIKESNQAGTRHYIWNKTDTLFTTLPQERYISLEIVKNSGLFPFNTSLDFIYKRKLMELVSKPSDNELIEAIKNRHKNKNGDFVLTADAPSYTFFQMKKIGNVYQVITKNIPYLLLE